MGSNHKVKPTILHLVTSLDIGGTERQLYLTLTKLNDFNHIVVCLQKWGVIGDKLRSLGFLVYFIPTSHLLSFNAIRSFKDVVNGIRPEIMITYLPFADIFGRIWGKWYGVPKIVCFLRSTMREWRYFPLVLLNIATQRLVDCFFAVSVTTKDFYEKWGLKKGTTDVIYNGVEIDCHAPPRSARNDDVSLSVIARAKPEAISSNDGGVVIGYVARLRKERGHTILLRAVERLKHIGTNVRLVLVGDGPYRSYLEKEAQRLDIGDRVSFLGYQSDTKNLLRSFTIYCHPSLYEGMSNALLEAMAAGCVIITSDIPENREILKHQHSALLVLPKNPEGLSRAIKELVNNEKLRDFLSSNAKKEAEKFNIINTVNQLRYNINDLFYK